MAFVQCSSANKLCLGTTYFQENVRETVPEVGTVNVELLLAWDIDVLASWAIDFHTAS